MKTPRKEEIVERARELWHIDRARDGDEGFALSPELNELAESGYISTALSDLMTGIENKNARWFDQKETDSKVENFAEKADTEVSMELPFSVEECMDTGFFVSGTSQSGKTNLCKLLVKKLIESGVVCYAIDPSGAWDNGPIENVVSIMGNEKNVRFSDNTVFDVSLLGTRQKVRFADTVCGHFFNQHVTGQTDRREFILFEESQCYLPNGCMRLAIRRESPCENIINLITVGANYKLRFGLVTQFPAMVDKLPVKISGQRYFGRTSEPNDVAYLKGFLGRDWAAKLKLLQKGAFVYQLRGDIRQIQTEMYGKSKGWYNYELPLQIY